MDDRPPPEFVDEEDASSCTEPDDVPIRTVAGFVKLYSGFPPWCDRLPRSVDRAQLEGVRAVVDAMAAVSAAAHVDIVFEYADEAIGWIQGGAPDDSLTVGLLGEWERVLRERESRTE